MWEAIKYVGSGITLVAFAIAAAVATYRSRLIRDERLIRTAPEDQRAELVRNALEFFNVETGNLTRQQQYDIALEQIRARGKRFQISAIVVVVISLVVASITAYAINRSPSEKEDEANSPKLSEFVGAGHPLGMAEAEYAGSAVQVFERGWMVASFKDLTLYAIGIDGDKTIRWYKKRETEWTKGIPVKGDGGPGDNLLSLGFRWYYFHQESGPIRQLLGRPLSGEGRAWLQFQQWSNGRVIYGIPGNSESVNTGVFEELVGVLLLKEALEQSGEGKFQRVYANTNNAYCGAAWYGANKDRSLPNALREQVDGGKCPSVRGPDFFTAPHKQIVLE